MKLKTFKIDRLIEYLKLNSVANTKANMQTSKWLVNWMESFCNEIDLIGEINPLVRGYIEGKSDKTICIYGHYDVQSAKSTDGWNTDPFDPVITNEKIIARGSCDNKGQNFSFLIALENLIKKGQKPNNNILLLLEGEEEIGSPHLQEYLLKNKEKNRADYYLLADGTSPLKKYPAIYTGSLGVVFGLIEVDNGKGDLHSGIYSAEVKHPAQILSLLLNDLYSNSAKIIPELEIVDKWSFSVTHLSAGTDPKKSIIPGKAKAMVGYRFSNGISSDIIKNELLKYLDKIEKHEHVNISFTSKVICEACEVSQSSRLYNTCKNNLDKLSMKFFTGRMQGSLPVASVIKKLYKKDALIISFGSKDNNTHGANEFMRIKNMENSIEFFNSLYISNF